MALRLTQDAIATIVQNPIDFDHAIHDKRGGVVLLVEQGNIWTVVAHLNKWGDDVKGELTFNAFA